MNTYSVYAEIIVQADSDDQAITIAESLRHPSIEFISVDNIEEIEDTPAPECPHCQTTEHHVASHPHYNAK